MANINFGFLHNFSKIITHLSTAFFDTSLHHRYQLTPIYNCCHFVRKQFPQRLSTFLVNPVVFCGHRVDRMSLPGDLWGRHAPFVQQDRESLPYICIKLLIYMSIGGWQAIRSRDVVWCSAANCLQLAQAINIVRICRLRCICHMERSGTVDVIEPGNSR